MLLVSRVLECCYIWTPGEFQRALGLCGCQIGNTLSRATTSGLRISFPRLQVTVSTRKLCQQELGGFFWKRQLLMRQLRIHVEYMAYHAFLLTLQHVWFLFQERAPAIIHMQGRKCCSAHIKFSRGHPQQHVLGCSANHHDPSLTLLLWTCSWLP